MWKVTWIPFIVKNNLQDPRLWQSLFSCYISWASPWLSFHSCNYDIFIPGVPTARGQAAFTSGVGVHFLSQGDAAAILEAHFRTTLTTIMLCEVLASVPTRLLYTHRGLRACRSIHRVYSVTIRSFWAQFCTVFLQNPYKCVLSSRTKNSPYIHVAPFDGYLDCAAWN
jgi:hypothetical protein